MIVERLMKEDANGVPCDNCAEMHTDDNGVELEFTGSADTKSVGLCSRCRDELIGKLIAVRAGQRA